MGLHDSGHLRLSQGLFQIVHSPKLHGFEVAIHLHGARQRSVSGNVLTLRELRLDRMRGPSARTPRFPAANNTAWYTRSVGPAAIRVL